MKMNKKLKAIESFKQFSKDFSELLSEGLPNTFGDSEDDIDKDFDGDSKKEKPKKSDKKDKDKKSDKKEKPKDGKKGEFEYSKNLQKKINEVKADGYHEKKVSDFIQDIPLEKDLPLDIISKLSKVKEMNINATAKIKYEKVYNTRIIKSFPMETYGEMSQLTSMDLLDKSFDKRFLLKDFQIMNPYKVETEIQRLIMLVDDSGSMSSNMNWVKAIFWNRLNQVKLGKAELFICTFEEKLDPYWLVVDTAEKVKDAWNKFNSYFGFNRSGTNVAEAVESAIELSFKNEFPTKTGIERARGKRPQITVVNDGQDYIPNNYIPSIPVNGIILDNKNPEMQRMCTNSGGIYVELHR